MDIEGRKPTQTQGLRALATLSLSALGIIYSDIGTSPLYVVSGIFPSAGPIPSTEDIVGAISAIVWTLTLLPLIKYSLIALCFGTDEGEGGVFALWMGLFPRKMAETDDRALTNFSTKDSGMNENDVGERFGAGWLAKCKVPLLVWAFFGTSLVLADGILTPAVSVVSAVGGIAVAQPNILNAVVPVSLGFLIVLFLVQRFGTHSIGLFFGPLTMIWHLLMASTGIYNIASHPAIFRAFDPSRAIMFFVRTKNFDALSGVLLAVTGCEAIFANLGSFTPASIRVGFLVAYAALVLQYLGQGARLIVDRENTLTSPFYKSIPGPIGGGLYWIVFIFAVIACLIASQTMITASFSLIQQLISMDCFPAIRMRHTSSTLAGQVYFPAINYLLLVAVVAVVAGFGTETALTNAYGFAVSSVMLVTGSLLFLQMIYVKRLPWLVGIAFAIFYLFIDGCFWGASLRKVPHGAWFTLAVGGVLLIFMSFYSWGRYLEMAYDSKGVLRLSRIISRFPGPAEHDQLDLKAPLTSSSPPGVHVALVPLPSMKRLASGPRPAGSYEIEDELEGEDSIDDSEAPLLPPSTLNERLWLSLPDGEQRKLELPRISTLAVFHKASSSAVGVPRSFYAFLRRWPSVPRVVIFLSTRVVGAPFVSLEDRYLVTKVRSLDGFYGITMRAGYRDPRTANVDDILPLLHHIEASFDPRNAAVKNAEISAAAANCTHILPSYVLQSKMEGQGPVAYIRRVLVEELYARLRTMFPDESSAQDGSEELIKVGVLARV